MPYQSGHHMMLLLKIDRRLAKGGLQKLGMNSAKYVDNIIEGIASVVNGETTLLGEELRVASREGKSLILVPTELL